MTTYVDLVCAEIRATKRLGDQPLQTVSFGGGVSHEGLTKPSHQALEHAKKTCAGSN